VRGDSRLPTIVLNEGRERPIEQGNHWIFSGAIAEWPERFVNGDICEVVSARGKYLGYGYFRHGNSLAGQMLSFDHTPVEQKIHELLLTAIELRELEFAGTQTDCYRLVNGIGDSLPGLTVDKYAEALVVQISTQGMDRLKELIVDELIEQCRPKFVYEMSDMPTRKQEGLPQVRGMIYGKQKEAKVTVQENGYKFIVDFEKAHKTGLYLDQREMRRLVGERSQGKRVLNCFAYTGGFSVYAAAMGAAQVTTLDISSEVVEQAERNFSANGLDPKDEKYDFLAVDAFKFLREQGDLDYDLVILDPPAFAKQQKDIPNAVKGYREINYQAIKRMPVGSYLLTCSCSYHVDQETFQKTVGQAAQKAGKRARIIHRHRMGSDHPLNLAQAENDYLKSLLLYLD
jgi:23S rRNA (cytosine1962-C5)-methyltransferase